MNLESQVVSLELAKKLKDLGVKQESAFYWVPDGDEENVSWSSPNLVPHYDLKALQKETSYEIEAVSAFTFAELIEWISERQNEWAIGYDDSGCFWRFKSGERGCGSMMEGFGHNYSSNDAESLVDALSEYIIYLIKEKGFKP